MTADQETVHIAGVAVHVGPMIRQVCSWCGYQLINYNTERMAVPIGQEGPPATWSAGELVAVCGPMAYVVDHQDGAPLPAESCTYDPATDDRVRVTRERAAAREILARELFVLWRTETSHAADGIRAREDWYRRTPPATMNDWSNRAGALIGELGASGVALAVNP